MAIQLITPTEWFANQMTGCNPAQKTQLFRLPRSVAMSLYGQIDQSASVSSGAVDQTIFTYTVPSGMRLFIHEWANTMYSGTSLKILVDGELYESSPIRRKLGKFDEPTSLPRPMYVYKKFEVKATNTTDDAKCMEFYANGVAYNYGEFRHTVLKKVVRPDSMMPPQGTDTEGCGDIPRLKEGESFGLFGNVQPSELKLTDGHILERGGR